MAPSSSVDEAPMWQKIVGISLALASGCLIGSSVVFTKKGLMMSRSIEPGRQHAYLKNYMWWIGMILTALGEVANFGAYAFAPAILVTPLGAISVVISAVLSSFFLKERLNFSGKVGCALCIIGATIIVLHAPASSSTQTINEFISYILAPSFLVYTIVLASILLFLIFYLKPRYGQRSPLIYISISSIIGAYLVLSASGFGAALVYSVRNWNTDNQFKQWAIYPVFAFIVVTVILQIHFLNLGLAYFSASVVTPIYYVFFTTATLVTSAVLFRGFPVDSAAQGLSIVMGFMVIVGGVALLFEYSMQLLAAAAAANASAATAVASSVSSIHNNNIAGGAAGAADKNSGTAGPTGRMSRSGSVTSSLAPVGLRRSSATAVGGGMVQLPERRLLVGVGCGLLYWMRKCCRTV
ncbi:magnesium transporter NIPA-domain-containing protein [Chytridium lagenaria]|nr:magnesium transporter NIPA-domain-containing protein [Chytridium lagenaria]